MKRIFALFIVCSVFGCNSYAQVFEDTRKLQFALSLEPSMGWLKTNSDQVASNGVKLGFGYGLMVDYYFSETRQSLFSSGLFLDQVGLKYVTTDSMGTALATKVKVQYLSVPLTLKLKTKEIGYLTYYMQFGAAPAFAIRSSYNQEPSGIEGADAKDLTNLFNVFFTGGAGVEYSILRRMKVFGGIYYNTGFLDAISNVSGDVKPRYVSVRAGLMF